MNENVLAAAYSEVESPVFGGTQQLLETHKLLVENNRPVVAGSRPRPAGNDVVVYFAVAGEVFHFTVTVGATPPWEVQGVGVVSYCRLAFHATSYTLSLPESAALTTLPATEGWNKGAQNRWGIKYPDSSLTLQPACEPGEFADKIGPLLSYPEQDAAGIRQLVAEHHGFLEACIVFHNGNTPLGGMELTPDSTRRLVALNVYLVFDVYAKGNAFTD